METEAGPQACRSRPSTCSQADRGFHGKGLKWGLQVEGRHHWKAMMLHLALEGKLSAIIWAVKFCLGIWIMSSYQSCFNVFNFLQKYFSPIWFTTSLSSASLCFFFFNPLLGPGPCSYSAPTRKALKVRVLPFLILVSTRIDCPSSFLRVSCALHMQIQFPFLWTSPKYRLLYRDGKALKQNK